MCECHVRKVNILDIKKQITKKESKFKGRYYIIDILMLMINSIRYHVKVTNFLIGKI